MHARMHAHTHAHTLAHTNPPPSLFAVSVHPTMTTMTPSWLGAPLSTLARQWPVGDPLK